MTLQAAGSGGTAPPGITVSIDGEQIDTDDFCMETPRLSHKAGNGKYVLGAHGFFIRIELGAIRDRWLSGQHYVTVRVDGKSEITVPVRIRRAGAGAVYGVYKPEDTFGWRPS